MMAEIAEQSGASEAIYWRRLVAQLEPNVPANFIALANTALRFNEVASAEYALNQVNEAGRQSPAYHEAAARLGSVRRQPKDAESHIAEAARLDPTNETYQFQLACFRLSSTVPETRKQAMAAIEKVVANDTLRRPALRALMQAAAAEGDALGALGYAERLRNGPGATFEDRMLHLDILRQLGRREFWWGLSQVLADQPINPDRITSVMTWLNNNALANVALMFAERVPREVRTKVPVVIALAESYGKLGDWAGMKPVLKYSEWGDLEYERQALFARVARGEGDQVSSRTYWNNAVSLSGERPESLNVLLGFTTSWKWPNEYNGLLWVAARGKSNPGWALAALLRKYSAEEKTRELMNVFVRMLELDPKNATLKNNVAYSEMLLNINLQRAAALAAEAHAAEPENASFAATYAYGLHLLGKTKDAIKVIEPIEDKKAQEPAFALAWAVLLAASGNAAEARTFLDLAMSGHLLPEEQKLASITRQKLARP
jgi:tetratricopeptide (TPR) repeat protein